MYKLIDIFNVKRNGNVVKSAEYKVLHTFETFDYDEETEGMLLSFAQSNGLKEGQYTVVEYKGDEPVAAVGQFYYDDDPYLDTAEWDNRVLASVALGRNMI